MRNLGLFLCNEVGEAIFHVLFLYVSRTSYSDGNGYVASHSAAYDQYTAVPQQFGVEFVDSQMAGFRNRATQRVRMDIPPAGKKDQRGGS